LGHYILLRRWEKWFSQLDEIKKEIPGLYKEILKDKKELLEIDWENLEFKE